MNPTRIILCTLNAKYIHASLGLRYLLANMARHGGADLRAQTLLREFTIARPVDEIAQELLALLPEGSGVQIIGLGVYIWNVRQTTALVRTLKALRPEIRIVLGGPEVSYEWDEQEIVRLADYLITGWGDVSFPRLCRALIHGPQPLMKVIAGEQVALDEIAFPYAEYSERDLAQRLLYVEASRGCPFKCEFCLSALDKTAWAFDLDAFLRELDDLFQRGARNFKFVDRTFNLKIDSSIRILEFFLERMCEGLFLHFELVPDHLPERLKTIIARFPPGSLQFEIGIQSFDPQVQQRISRRQDNAKTEENLHWLLNHSTAHLHTDLIFGLPGEDMRSFARGFDRLYACDAHEIQLGILKRLRGTPIARHSAEHEMVYSPQAPYTVESTAVIPLEEMQRFKRFARYWDLIANSGRFRLTLPALLQGESAFAEFMSFSDWLWGMHPQTSGLSPEFLLDSLFDYLCTVKQLPAARVLEKLLADYQASGARSNPRCLQALLGKRGIPSAHKGSGLARRQARHNDSV